MDAVPIPASLVKTPLAAPVLSDTKNDPTAPPVTACGEKEGPAIEKEDPVVLTGDSYWVLEEAEGDMRQYTPDGDDLLTDLTLWADGTARIREIEGDMWRLSDGDEQNMTWRCEEDGTFLLYTARSGDEVLDVDAIIYCERESHKGMIIGKGGATLKRIATQARGEMERFFQIQVNLKCWVKVKEDWRNREQIMRSFGYTD